MNLKRRRLPGCAEWLFPPLHLALATIVGQARLPLQPYQETRESLSDTVQVTAPILVRLSINPASSSSRRDSSTFKK
jgi:hypothetical protein